ncbi:MAG: helix-hairpin-helix domain-containing protein [Saprospiraceae bacterium]
MAKAKPAPKAAVAKESAPKAETKTSKDNLTKIEGIGPKIAEIFNNAGILTFAHLAAADVEQLKNLLSEAGPRFTAHDPTTWPQQATFAADGKWDELKAWQDTLDGGRIATNEEE